MSKGSASLFRATKRLNAPRACFTAPSAADVSSRSEGRGGAFAPRPKKPPSAFRHSPVPLHATLPTYSRTLLTISA